MRRTTPGTGCITKLNRRRALFVLDKVDEILSWERHAEQEKDTRFVELGRYLCEVRAGQYWRLENLGSFDDFLTKRFPESRRKAYYLMAIHEQLPRRIHHDLQQVGWAKAAELAKVARRDGERFDCATWLHKAIELPKEGFKREVERHLTGQETEPWEIIYFKLYKSQLPVIERALETAALMLGASKSRGYCLEMICADFLPELTWKVVIPSHCSSHSADFIHCFRIHRKWNSCSKWGKFNERFPTATTETSARRRFLSQTPQRSVAA
jgi:hypothetical protein